MKTLYLLTIKKGCDFYVLANTPSDAKDELERLLNKAEWWFSSDREVVNIKILSKEYHCFPENHPVFGERGGDLIIINDNKR